MFATRIEKDILKSLKLLSVYTEKPMSTLLEEAILELVKKYKKDKSFDLYKMP